MAEPFQKCKTDWRSPLYPCEKQKCGHPWTVRYREPGGRSGRQREQSFPRKTEASQFGTKVENDKHAGVYIDPDRGRATLKDVSAEWLSNRLSIKERTRDRADSFFRTWLWPELGHKSVARIDRAEVQKFVRTMAAGLNPSTVSVYFGILRSVMLAAVADKRITETPCVRIELPEVNGRAVEDDEIPTATDINVIAKLMADQDELIVWLMSGCGLRISEALGVSLDMVRGDFIRLSHQISPMTPGTSSFAPLKHRKPGEFRDVPLPDYVREKLDEHVERFGTHTVEGRELLFHPGPRSATPAMSANLMGARWRRSLKYDPMGFTPHSMRHYFASTALAANVPIHEVSRWIGHKSIQLTVDTYGHLTEQASGRCRDALQGAFELAG